MSEKEISYEMKARMETPFDEFPCDNYEFRESLLECGSPECFTEWLDRWKPVILEWAWKAEKWASFRESFKRHQCKYGDICTEKNEVERRLNEARRILGEHFCSFLYLQSKEEACEYYEGLLLKIKGVIDGEEVEKQRHGG